jgi:Putative Actinobacterial Holin-X, holin superfamily III
MMQTSPDAATGEPAARPPRGLGEQAGRLRGAVERLIRAHIDLARAELSEIAGQIKRMVALIGLAIALVFFALLLIVVGLPLFLGEWLFGSMGWGLLLGVLLSVALAVSAVASALGASRRAVWLPASSGLLVAIALALALGSDMALRAAAELAVRGSAALRVSLPSGAETLTAAVVAGAFAGAVVLVAVGVLRRRSLRGVRGLLVDGVVLGAIVGAMAGAGHYTWPLAVANGLAVGLIVWIVSAIVAFASIDASARFEHLTPTTTIETARETWEWVRARIRPATR